MILAGISLLMILVNRVSTAVSPMLNLGLSVLSGPTGAQLFALARAIGFIESAGNFARHPARTQARAERQKAVAPAGDDHGTVFIQGANGVEGDFFRAHHGFFAFEFGDIQLSIAEEGCAG